MITKVSKSGLSGPPWKVHIAKMKKTHVEKYELLKSTYMMYCQGEEKACSKYEQRKRWTSNIARACLDKNTFTFLFQTMIID